jgi:hypothetical protein
MWIKVLSLLILAILSLNVQASPFGHLDEKNTQLESLTPSHNQDYSQQTSTLTLTDFDTICVNQETSTPELECCHLDTCSVFILNDINDSSLLVFLDSHPILTRWPYTPISPLKKPPKFTVV